MGAAPRHSLYGNDIGPERAIALAEAFAKMPNLTSVE